MQNKFNRAKLLVSRINNISFVLSEHYKLSDVDTTEMMPPFELIEYLRLSTEELTDIFEVIPEPLGLPIGFYPAS